MAVRKSKSKNKGGAKQIASASNQSHVHDLEDLQHEELSGSADEKPATATSTDEDENEGLGDGNVGRSRSNILNKE